MSDFITPNILQAFNSEMEKIAAVPQAMQRLAGRAQIQYLQTLAGRYFGPQMGQRFASIAQLPGVRRFVSPTAQAVSGLYAFGRRGAWIPAPYRPPPPPSFGRRAARVAGRTALGTAALGGVLGYGALSSAPRVGYRYGG